MRQTRLAILSRLLAALALGAVVGAAFGQSLPTWNGSFTDQNHGKPYPFTMVGGDPSSTGTTPVSVYVIPVKVTFSTTTCQSGQSIFDPTQPSSNGISAVNNVLRSPLFTAINGFPEGSGGAVQYIDAFQRGNFWGAVQQNGNVYHLVLAPSAPVAEQTILVPAADGAALDDPTVPRQYGGCIGAVALTFLDDQLGSLLVPLLQQQQIQPSGLAMFVLYDVFYGYDSAGWYPIGAGLHTVAYGVAPGGPQTWLWAAYNDGACMFNGLPLCLYQDVDDFSHELAEWADDPFAHTAAPCGLLEVGDPLLGLETAAYYTYIGTNGTAYHLQDLVFLPYFGAAANTSYNGQTTFQGEALTYCEYGG